MSDEYVTPGGMIVQPDDIGSLDLSDTDVTTSGGMTIFGDDREQNGSLTLDDVTPLDGGVNGIGSSVESDEPASSVYTASGGNPAYALPNADGTEQDGFTWKGLTTWLKENGITNEKGMPTLLGQLGLGLIQGVAGAAAQSSNQDFNREMYNRSVADRREDAETAEQRQIAAEERDAERKRIKFVPEGGLIGKVLTPVRPTGLLMNPQDGSRAPGQNPYGANLQVVKRAGG